jgi:polyhydroxybutyrate depolymerase
MTCRRTRFLAMVLALLLAGCSDPESEIAKTDYGAAAEFACAAGDKPGAAGVVDGERTEQGADYNLRTPANYNPRIAHPLIVVYAPLRSSAAGNEWFTRLTRVATAAGFIVAYAQSRSLRIPSIVDLGTIPGRIAAKWCIDTERIYLTGQWQGGSVVTALAALEQTRGLAAAIAPSGAGFTGEDMEALSCPDPLPVMVMHSKDDELYPGFGPPAAKWWASCNRCEAEPRALAKGCVAYPNCAKGVATLYCEGGGEHVRWFERNTRVIDFFRSVAQR